MISDDIKGADRIIESIIESTEHGLGREFAKALKTIRAELAEFAARLPKLEYEEAVKYNRLINLEKTIGKELSKTYQIAKSRLDSGLKQVYTEGYHVTTFAIEKNVQVKLGFGQLNKKTIEMAIAHPFKDIAWLRGRAEAKRRLQSELTQGLLNGESYSDIAQRFKKIMQSQKDRALVTARTEAHRVMSQATLDCSKKAAESNIELVKIWSAALDERTRDTHQEMDGQRVGLDEDFKSPSGASGPAPGMLGDPAEDINCRCRMTVDLKSGKIKSRRARDPDTEDGPGKNRVIPFKTYKEWKENRL